MNDVTLKLVAILDAEMDQLAAEFRAAEGGIDGVRDRWLAIWRLRGRAMRGEFHDYKSEHPCPKAALVGCLREVGLAALADRVAEGEFDEGLEEAQAWWTREGEEIFCPTAGDMAFTEAEATDDEDG